MTHNINKVLVKASVQGVTFDSLNPGELFDYKSPPTFPLMKTSIGYVSLANGNYSSSPPYGTIYPIPIGSIVMLEVGTRGLTDDIHIKEKTSQ